MSVGQACCSRRGPYHDAQAPLALVRHCGYPVGAQFNTLDQFRRFKYIHQFRSALDLERVLYQEVPVVR